MQGLYIGCIALSGLAMVAITAIIPSGVFMRYVMNDPLQWPEPASVIMMVFFSFVGGAAVYRANAQIARGHNVTMRSSPVLVQFLSFPATHALETRSVPLIAS